METDIPDLGAGAVQSYRIEVRLWVARLCARDEPPQGASAIWFENFCSSGARLHTPRAPVSHTSGYSYTNRATPRGRWPQACKRALAGLVMRQGRLFNSSASIRPLGPLLRRCYPIGNRCIRERRLRESACPYPTPRNWKTGLAFPTATAHRSLDLHVYGLYSSCVGQQGL